MEREKNTEASGALNATSPVPPTNMEGAFNLNEWEKKPSPSLNLPVQTLIEEKVERAPPIELPSIGVVTGIKNSGAGAGSNLTLGKGGGPPPIGPTLQRPNIIQLPGNILAGKGPLGATAMAGPHPHGIHGQPLGAPRIISPTYTAPPPGYGHVMMGPAGLANYHVPPPPSSQAPQPQKMELHDAFAYLDRVKAEFSDQPDVYNRFLQIMREFKANAIDANGVIVRVVQLFKGHKALIQGFNAFLPRTHHIDPVVAETGILPPHLMQVAASMGIAVNSQGIPMSLPSVSGPREAASSTYPSHWIPEGANNGEAPPPPPPPPPHPQGYYGPPGQYMAYSTSLPTRPPSSIPPVPYSLPPNTTPVPSSMALPPSAPPISTPAVGPPTPTNKKSSAQFVRAISYVKKIKHRFANAPDIYKTFLAALHSYHKEQKTIFEVYMEVANLFTDHPDLLEEFVLFLPENEATIITSRLAQAGMAPIGVGQNVAPSTTSTATMPAAVAPKVEAKPIAAPKRPVQAPLPPGKSSKRARQAAAMANRSAEESAFYERVKRFLGDKQAYAEFLKCLNLFCQDIIKIHDLVLLVQRFIGQNEELFGWFKRYIGYKDNPVGSEGPIWRLGSTLVNEHGELNLAACKKTGSYRLYPKSHVLPRSSFRTPIGLEVLNDIMVSCPVFNSEDSTFIASKKNQYEEALFRCEDERFEIDLLIEYNLASIAVFEPLARKIELMTPEERANLTLGPNLGGTSIVIYKKAIRKIYGEKADEVLSSLQKNPAAAVPVVLRRLKQKDEEWRRVQRDWNKIWRDIHLKNYYKALDHQGVEFRATDRRNISGRNLITEIETIAGERRRAIERGGSLSQPHQLEFTCRGADELASDLASLIRAYVKSAPTFSGNDRKAVLRFLTSFLPGFFALTPAVIAEDNNNEKVRDGRRRQVSASDRSSDSSEEADSEGNGTEAREAEDFMDSDSVLVPKDKVAPQTATPVLLFANNSLYILVRLLQMSMERLEKMQAASKAANGAPFFTEKKNIVASFLDLQTEASSELQADFYSTLLVLLRQLITGSLDPGVFDERVRFMFGTAAYPIFTFDKLLQTLVKQIQVVLGDSPCEQLVRLFDSWNSRKAAMRLSEYSVRLAVENTISGKENIYRIEYTPKTGRLTLQLLDRLSDATATGASAEARWSAYVDNFVKLESNDCYLSATSKVFLPRNRRREPSIDPKIMHVHYNLECKIAINTYKLFYVENTEDYLWRARRVLSKGSSSAPSLRQRFNEWLGRLANKPKESMD